MAELYDTAMFKGLTELGKVLDTLPPKIEKNVTGRAMRAGAKVIKAEVDKNLEKTVKTGVLKKGIKIVSRSKAGRVHVFIRTTGKHAYVAKWLEWGTQAHLIGARRTAAGRFVSGLGGLAFLGIFRTVVSHPGINPERTKFMRPAFDAKGLASVVATAEAMKKILKTKEGLDVPDTEIEVVV